MLTTKKVSAALRGAGFTSARHLPEETGFDLRGNGERVEVRYRAKVSDPVQEQVILCKFGATLEGVGLGVDWTHDEYLVTFVTAPEVRGS